MIGWAEGMSNRCAPIALGCSLVLLAGSGLMAVETGNSLLCVDGHLVIVDNRILQAGVAFSTFA